MSGHHGAVPTLALPRLPACLGTTLGAVLGGLCLAASVPPWGWWPLAFVGVAIWDRLLADASPRSRFLRSWLRHHAARALDAVDVRPHRRPGTRRRC